MSQKFRAFDFQSVKQSFMRQEMLEKEKKSGDSDNDANANSDTEDNSNLDEVNSKEDEDELNEYMQSVTNNSEVCTLFIYA